MFLKACPEKFAQAKNPDIKPGKVVLKKNACKKITHVKASKPTANKNEKEQKHEPPKTGLGLAMFHFM